MAKREKAVPVQAPGGVTMMAGPKQRPRKKRPNIHVEQADNGGFVVRAGHNGGGMDYQPPTEHVYGADEHEKVMEHVRKHMGMNRKAAASPRKGRPFGSAPEPEEEPDGDEE